MSLTMLRVTMSRPSSGSWTVRRASKIAPSVSTGMGWSDGLSDRECAQILPVFDRMSVQRPGLGLPASRGDLEDVVPVAIAAGKHRDEARGAIHRQVQRAEPGPLVDMLEFVSDRPVRQRLAAEDVTPESLGVWLQRDVVE